MSILELRSWCYNRQGSAQCQTVADRASPLQLQHSCFTESAQHVLSPSSQFLIENEIIKNE
jgi:hypothetical protein